jgi:SSS family solute:Na+ symporter
VQALFSFFIAPLLGTVLLGMLSKRVTPKAGFWGLLSGVCSSIAMWAWVAGVDLKISWGLSALLHVHEHVATYWQQLLSSRHDFALGIIALSPNAKDMAENMYRALWCFLICAIVTVVVSMFTEPKPESELVGLVYGCTEIPKERDETILQKPIFWAAIVAVVFLVLQIIFW